MIETVHSNSDSSLIFRPNQHAFLHGLTRLLTPGHPSRRANRMRQSNLTTLYHVHPIYNSIPGYRFVRSTNPAEMLMFVDGSALNSGCITKRSSYIVVFASFSYSKILSWRKIFKDRIST